jgi:hypothetical protein
LIWPFRFVATCADVAHARCRVRSLHRLGLAVRSGQLNRPGVQEFIASEAGVALASVRVQDPEGRPAARRAGPIAGDDYLRSLADDVSTEPDPGSTGELQPDARRLTDGAGKTAGPARVRWLEHDEGDTGPPGQRRQSTQPVGEVASAAMAGTTDTSRQVDDQQIDRSTGQQRAGDRQALVRIGRCHDHEPLRLDPPGHDLDGVQHLGEVQPRDDRPRGLCCRRQPKGERGPAA